MTTTGMMMSAVSPQISAAPQPPMSSTDQPSEPSMKPGFARQITNPSYQRSVFRSWRSSTTASAMLYLPLVHEALANWGARANVTPARTSFNARGQLSPRLRRTIASYGPAPDHDHVRVRRGEEGGVRPAMAMRALRALVEHAADSG